MKKKSVKRYTLPKVALEPVIRMELLPFTAQIRMTAKTSVLGQLGITGKILRNMKNQDLGILYDMLAFATSQLTTEKVRRDGTKTCCTGTKN